MSHSLSWTILKHFSCKNVYGFTIQDAIDEFPAKNKVYLRRILADMVTKGMLYRIARDRFHIIPMNAVPETYVPDGLRLALYLMQGKEYYIGYSSALKVHGLLLHPGKAISVEDVYVACDRKINPAIRKYGSTSVHFIPHNEDRYFGYTSLYINGMEEAMVSDLEKTIVDLASKPQLCEGITELAHAIFQARGLLDYDKIFYYLVRNQSKSAKKRFLFLADLLGMEWTSHHEKMLTELGSGIQLLDPSAPDQGTIMRKFRLKINVDPKLIKQKVLH
jgi:predicted transcriptional regulator of viral defense system